MAVAPCLGNHARPLKVYVGSKAIEMEIIKAKTEHASEIVLLNNAVQKLHAEHHPKVFKYPTDVAEMERCFRNIISDDKNIVFLARIAGKAVGYVWCTIERRDDNAFSFSHERIYIHQLSVDPKYRRKGVGTRLMHAVDMLAIENGISKFALDSWEFNKEAHAFFTRLGFSCFNIQMWRETTSG